MKFIHIRAKDSQGNVFQRGGTTIGYMLREGRLVYAVTKCSKKDIYCRKTGRTICKDRYCAGQENSIAPMQGVPYIDLLVGAVT